MDMERELAPLPVPVWPILGRHDDIDLAVSLLTEAGGNRWVRLLTLTGPAGVGKTRLAWEVGRLVEETFDLTAYIPLASVHEGNAITREIASILRLPDSTEPIAGLRALFARQRVLLVLDNLEQISGAGLAISALLQGIRGLTVLATSRTRLSIAGEHVLTVEPLAAPDPGQTDATRIAESAAVQILLQAARAADASFRLPDDNWVTAAAIARRLDGLPLALELAGKRIPLLGAKAVLNRLDHALPLLSDGPRDRPERLQTMRGAIGWSYDLLTPDEQAFFRRLSVFNGGFTLEMAEAMARGWEPGDGYPFFFGIPFPYPWMIVGRGGPDLESGQWLPNSLAPLPIDPVAGLDALERMSVIRAVRTDSGIDRFDLLETIREFGLEQLDRHGERAAAEHARAVLLTGIAEMTSQAMWSGTWRPAVAWTEAELPNMRAALAWLETQPPEGNQLALRMVETLWPFWQSRGYVQEGCEHLEACLARPGGDPLMRAQALNLLGALCWIRNDLTRASSALDEALPVLERTSFFIGQGRNFMTRALVAWSWGEIDRMEKMALIGTDRYVRGGDVLGPSICRLILGFAQRLRGQREEAIASFSEAYRGCIGVPGGGTFPWGMAIAQYFLGEMAREDGNRVAAVSNIREALTAFVELGDPWTVGGCVGTLAIYLVEDGELEEAARLLGASDALESSTGVFLPPTETAIHEATAQDVKGRIGLDAFAALFAEGQHWPMGEAAAHAMRVPLESAAGRAARLAQPAIPRHQIPQLPAHHIRTLQLTADGLSIEEVALAEGKAPQSIYERFDRIRERFGLQTNASIANVMMLAVYYGIVDPRLLLPSN
jgi:predicted ATPase